MIELTSFQGNNRIVIEIPAGNYAIAYILTQVHSTNLTSCLLVPRISSMSKYRHTDTLICAQHMQDKRRHVRCIHLYFYVLVHYRPKDYYSLVVEEATIGTRVSSLPEQSTILAE